MTQLRQDPATREWVIVAAERARRPDQFQSLQKQRPPEPPHDPKCPFCPGNESLAPPEIFSIKDEKGGWRVRVVPNKFPALAPAGNLVRREEHDFFRWTDGVGHHEVIIETPVHNSCLALLPEDHVIDVVRTYRERYRAMRHTPNVAIVVIFRNHGEKAGTSLRHPHSQLVAVPVVPNNMRQLFEEATRYYDDNNSCVHCDIAAKELDAKVRLIESTDGYAAFNPFASTVPFETWIMPLAFRASFADTTDEEIAGFAKVLRRTLRRLHFGLGDPDYNFVIHAAPIVDEDEKYFTWHLRIVPRLTTRAGFEIGSGIYITTAVPEETAAFLREVKMPEG